MGFSDQISDALATGRTHIFCRWRKKTYILVVVLFQYTIIYVTLYIIGERTYQCHLNPTTDTVSNGRHITQTGQTDFMRQKQGEGGSSERKSYVVTTHPADAFCHDTGSRYINQCARLWRMADGGGARYGHS